MWLNLHAEYAVAVERTVAICVCHTGAETYRKAMSASRDTKLESSNTGCKTDRPTTPYKPEGLVGGRMHWSQNNTYDGTE